MKIEKIMTKDVVVCHPADSIQEVAETMRTLEIGSLPVVDRDRYVGFVTDRDIVNRSVAKGTMARVQDVMTPHLITIDHNASVQDGIDKMAQHQIRRLPVTQGEKLVGFVSLSDLQPFTAPKDFEQSFENITDPR